MMGLPGQWTCGPFLVSKSFRVQCNSGAHRAGHEYTLYISALRSGRLGLDDRIDQLGAVLYQLFGAEAYSSDRRMDDPGLVYLKRDLTPLYLVHSSSHIIGNRTGL